MDRDSVRLHFICPVCQSLPLTEPVLAADGFIYHKECIKHDDHYKDKCLISPMTGKEVKSTLIESKSIKATLSALEECEGQNEAVNEKNVHDETISEIKMKARLGDAPSMATLGRWYLFGEKEGVDKDVRSGCDLVRRATDEGNLEAGAYYGHCLIRGLGVEKDQKSGFELLVDAATSDGSSDGKDFGAYTLGWCYREGIYGFKCNENKSNKYFGRVVRNPDDVKIWGYTFDEEEETPPNPTRSQDIGGKLLFGDTQSVSTGTTLSTHEYSRGDDMITNLDFFSKTTKKCEGCSEIFELKDLMGMRCRDCVDVEFNGGFSYLLEE